MQSFTVGVILLLISPTPICCKLFQNVTPSQLIFILWFVRILLLESSYIKLNQVLSCLPGMSTIQTVFLCGSIIILFRHFLFECVWYLTLFHKLMRSKSIDDCPYEKSPKSKNNWCAIDFDFFMTGFADNLERPVHVALGSNLKSNVNPEFWFFLML